MIKLFVSQPSAFQHCKKYWRHALDKGEWPGFDGMNVCKQPCARRLPSGPRLRQRCSC